MPTSSINEFDSIWAPPNKAVDSQGVVHDLVQDAIDNSLDDEMVMVGPGTFQETLSGFPAGLTLRGAGGGTIIDGGGGVAITGDAGALNIEQLSVQNTVGGGAATNAIEIPSGNEGCALRLIRVRRSDASGITISGDLTSIIVPIVDDTDSSGVRFDGNANDCVVMGGIFQSQITGDAILIDNARVSAIANIIDRPGDDGIQVSADDSVIALNIINQATNRGVYDVGDTGPNTYIGNVSVGGANGDIVLDDAVAGTVAIGNIPEADNIAVPTADDLTDTGWVGRLVDSPNGHVMNAALDDGDSAEISIPVPNGETLKVYRWGAYKISDGSTPTGLDVELKDGSDTVQTTENTGNNESTDPTTPVASHANASGSISIFKLAVANDTGGGIPDPGVGAIFAYVVE